MKYIPINCSSSLEVQYKIHPLYGSSVTAGRKKVRVQKPWVPGENLKCLAMSSLLFRYSAKYIYPSKYSKVCIYGACSLPPAKLIELCNCVQLFLMCSFIKVFFMKLGLVFSILKPKVTKVLRYFPRTSSQQCIFAEYFPTVVRPSSQHFRIHFICVKRKAISMHEILKYVKVTRKNKMIEKCCLTTF